ncbi:hypothetical protein ACOSQ2_004010 [Xanthoceras sorbifolium]
MKNPKGKRILSHGYLLSHASSSSQLLLHRCRSPLLHRRTSTSSSSSHASASHRAPRTSETESHA